jgi:uncharacterized protein (TIGR03435 family)
MTRIALATMCGLLAGGALAAQDSATPRFEVVSVRENKAVGQGGAMSALTGSQFTTTNIPLRMIILSAYELRDVQLIGAPEWTRSARFDIAAKFPEGTPSAAERRLMVQNLLADRFGLVAHRDTRELPVFTLVMAREDRRLGPNLVPSAVDCVKWFAEKRSQIIGQGPIGPAGARPACMMVANRNYILAGTRTTAQLARALESVVGRPVVDETGLTGTFDIDVQWVPEPGVDARIQGPLVTAPAASGSIFTALQEQLGLRLESARGPVDVLVVDSVSRPTPD